MKKYVLEVYVLPIVLCFLTVVVVYFIVNEYLIPENLVRPLYIFATFPGFVLFVLMRKNWLKMPDNRYINVKDYKLPQKSYSEPLKYEIEYFETKTEAFFTIFVAVSALGFVVFNVLNSNLRWEYFVFCLLTAVLISYEHVNKLLKRSAILKVSKTGLWTKKLGFVKFDDIDKVEYVEKIGSNSSDYLSIYLKGTVFSDANLPTENLEVKNIKDKENLEWEIYNLAEERSEF